MGGAQLLAGVDAALLSPQPFAVEQTGASELDAMAAFGFRRRNDEFLFGVRTINFSAKFVEDGSAGDRNNGAGLLFEYRRLLRH